MPKKSEKAPPKHVTLPLKWHVPPEIVSRFATNIVIQSIEEAFKISFFEAKPEIRLQPAEKVPGEVRADCVACIIITAEKLPAMIDALKRHLASHNELKKQSQTKL